MCYKFLNMKKIAKQIMLQVILITCISLASKTT
ncbi:MAG: hypothetical protein IM562_09755, partial [Chitinophagaceae bacterium]|nr:hypothetical protein [Chitinophagaceae bacterium]